MSAEATSNSAEQSRRDWRIWFGITATIGWLALGSQYILGVVGLGEEPPEGGHRRQRAGQCGKPHHPFLELGGLAPGGWCVASCWTWTPTPTWGGPATWFPGVRP